MGLFSRKHEPTVDPRALGTWTWYGNANQWSIEFNNRLGQLLGLKLDDFVQGLKELRHGQEFSATPIDGQRIDISGMYGIGDDYRWYAYVHGEDGRHYFFRKFDNALARQKGINPPQRQADEIDLIPFEANGPVPSGSTHRPEALATSPDQVGENEKPTIYSDDEDMAEFLARIADYESMSYDDLVSFMLGGAKPWQEGVLGELKRRHEAGVLDRTALDESVKEYKAKVAKRIADTEQMALKLIEARLRKAMAHDFDPPGGWGVLGAD